MSDAEDSDVPTLVDFAALGRWVRRAVLVLGSAGVVAGAIALVRGATWLEALGWIGLATAGIALVAGVGTFWHAVRGAQAAAARGERLGGGDVGLIPPRPQRPQWRGGSVGDRVADRGAPDRDRPAS